MTTLLRYNPALLADEDLVASFVVREPELRQLLDAVRASADAPANQHLLVLGQRGMGKTTLVRRLALAVRESPDLSGRWFPLSFGEEAYEVATAGQLWWQALAHLGQQTGDARWLRVHEELRAEPDDRRLHDRALSALLDFADARGQRLLLVVENLHMLLDEQLSPDEAWVLRKTLQTEPRVLLLATATGRFGAIEDQGQALYGLFRPFPLRPLDLEGCRRVWQAVAGVELAPTRARAVEILTGGNPRLLAILAAFAGGRSLRALMTDLVRVVDEHTTYFKACLESLPAQERRVFVALADLWTPSPASAVAERARVDVNAASALLSRLVSRGAVEVESQEGRRKYYQVAERLYNVYYLLRRAGRADARVEATVRLMTHLYEPEALAACAADVAAEALRLPDRREHYEALELLLRQAASAADPGGVIESLDGKFLTLSDLPAGLRGTLLELCASVVKPAADVPSLMDAGRFEEAERVLARVVATLPKIKQLAPEVLAGHHPRSWATFAGLARYQLGLCAAWLGRHEVAATQLVEALDEFTGGDAERGVWRFRREILRALWLTLQRLGRTEEATKALEQAVVVDQLGPMKDREWSVTGGLLLSLGRRLNDLSRHEDACARLTLALEAFERDSPSGGRREEVRRCRLERAISLLALRRLDEAARDFAEAGSALAEAPAPVATVLTWGRVATLVLLGRHDDALAAYAESLALGPADAIDRGWEVDLLVDAAAAGLASEALAVLEGAPDDPFLAPVAVALRMDLGLPHRAPREHLELARDLAQRIDARRRALTAPTAPASPPEAR